MMKKYCVGFVFTPDLSRVLLIWKNGGPYPQTLNGVGGKIEATDKTPELAMRREILEETGIEFCDVRSIVMMSFPSGIELHCFAVLLRKRTWQEDFSLTDKKRIDEGTLYWAYTDKVIETYPHSAVYAGGGNTPYLVYEARNILMASL